MTRRRSFGRASATLAARLGGALVLSGCGGAPSAAREPEERANATPTDSSGSSGSPECAVARSAILAAMAASRDASTCTTPADCAVVTGPGHADPEYAEVVGAADAAALEARAEAHLAACGAFHHHEAIDAFRVVEAACLGGRCAANETTFHVEE